MSLILLLIFGALILISFNLKKIGESIQKTDYIDERMDNLKEELREEIKAEIKETSERTDDNSNE